MAMAILRGCVVNKKTLEFNPVQITREFIKWARSGPKDIGFTTRAALRYVI